MVFTISCIGMQRSSHPYWDNQVGKSSLDVALLLLSFSIISLISPMLRGCNKVSCDTSELVSAMVTGSGPAAGPPLTLLTYVFCLALSCCSLFNLTASKTTYSGTLPDCLLVFCLTKSHCCLVFCWLLSFPLINRRLLDRMAFCTKDLDSRFIHSGLSSRTFTCSLPIHLSQGSTSVVVRIFNASLVVQVRDARSVAVELIPLFGILKIVSEHWDYKDKASPPTFPSIDFPLWWYIPQIQHCYFENQCQRFYFWVWAQS